MKKLKRTKKVLKWLSIAALLYGMYVIGYAVGESTTPRYNVPATVGVTLSQDPVLVADAQQLGINYAPLNMKFSSGALTSLTETVDNGAIGLFTTPNSITIATGLSKKDELNILAYEYMHYAWIGLTAEQKQSLTSSYQHYRTINPDFNAEVSHYHGDEATIANEMNSTACTRVQPHLLTVDFNNYCNQFIKNRNILFQ